MSDVLPSSPFYPPRLATIEKTLINQRRAFLRKQGESSDLSDDAMPVGFALSGGGIRSATFCLGLFQALARLNLVRRIDVLSTVSGGGYFGGFLGAAFCRDKSSPAGVERDLANNESWPMRWLRDNGRFLSPNGAGDNWHAAAVVLRNWTAVHIVLLTFFLLVLSLAGLVRADLATWAPTQSAWNTVEQFFWENRWGQFWWSPWILVPAAIFAGIMVPTGSVYWLTQWAGPMSLIARLFATTRAKDEREFANYCRNALTRWLATALVFTVGFLLFAVIDSMGQTAYEWWARNHFEFLPLWTAFTGGGAIALGFGSRLVPYLERLSQSRRTRVPLNAIALACALGWLLLILLGLSVVVQGIGRNWDVVWYGMELRAISGSWPLTVTVALCLLASLFFGHTFGFVNLSSLEQLYAARLGRAYLGATNSVRQGSSNYSLTDLVANDTFAQHEYQPQRRGGPLHLVNVTVNETLSSKTQTERRDRKGVAMAIGPAGLSVGIWSHALWLYDPPAVPADKAHGLKIPLQWLKTLFERRPLHPVEFIPAPPDKFHVFCPPPSTAPRTEEASQKAATPNAQTQPPAGPPPTANSISNNPRGEVEALQFNRWMAISGAAFTTGTGANTCLGFSLLLGLANVRLGYWWNSKAGDNRCQRSWLNGADFVGRILTRMLPVQVCLLNEFLARFHGPARQHWYLSDGGHFENTACYELIRRRIPLIFAVDAGQDPSFRFGDFANLVRKARIDFGAEIQVVQRAKHKKTDDPGTRFPMPTVEQLVHPDLRDVIGDFDDFSPPQSQAGATPDAEPRFAACHAVLARVHYVDTDDFSWLLLIKPSLMGEESADVLEYHRTHPLFPQEPTSDQYFDEAQWESYRKLGEHIGVELFTPPSVTDRTKATWTPAQMKLPTAVPPGETLPPAQDMGQAVAAALAARATSSLPFEPMD